MTSSTLRWVKAPNQNFGANAFAPIFQVQNWRMDSRRYLVIWTHWQDATPWRLWTVPIKFKYLGCYTTWCRLPLKALQHLYQPKRFYYTLTPNIILFVVQSCLLAGSITKVETAKYLQWKIPTKILYRFHELLSDAFVSEVPFTRLSLLLMIISKLKCSLTSDLQIFSSSLLSALTNR